MDVALPTLAHDANGDPDIHPAALEQTIADAGVVVARQADLGDAHRYSQPGRITILASLTLADSAAVLVHGHASRRAEDLPPDVVAAIEAEAGDSSLLARQPQKPFANLESSPDESREKTSIRLTASLYRRISKRQVIPAQRQHCSRRRFSNPRMELVKALRRRTENEAILPASIGLHVHLPKLGVECRRCGVALG